MVTQYFGRVPKATRPVPRDIPKEPDQAKERRAVVEEAWPLPAVVVAYHVTYDGHPDAYPLHITAKIMSDGQSARIPLELMYKKRLALTAFGSGNINRRSQPCSTPSPSCSLGRRRGRRACAHRRVRQADAQPVMATELQRAKNQFARDYIVGRESNHEKALHLSHGGDSQRPRRCRWFVDIFMNVSTADVQRVARTYFTRSTAWSCTSFQDGLPITSIALPTPTRKVPGQLPIAAAVVRLVVVSWVCRVRVFRERAGGELAVGGTNLGRWRRTSSSSLPIESVRWPTAAGDDRAAP